jgi:hypothetical protein
VSVRIDKARQDHASGCVNDRGARSGSSEIFPDGLNDAVYCEDVAELEITELGVDCDNIAASNEQFAGHGSMGLSLMKGTV